MTAETFRELSRSVVSKFLQTAIVLDDGAYLIPEGEDHSLKASDPDPKAIAKEENDAEQGATTARGATPNALDARTLIDNFAVHGIVCSVLAPREREDLKKETLELAKRADIVILDWQILDEGQKATDIIKTLLTGDSSRRLRLVVVYTATDDLMTIRGNITKQIEGLISVDQKNGHGIALTNAHSRLVFLRKGSPYVAGKTVPEEQLVDQLINEFVELTKGLLANVALASIAAIRDETHRILARFPNSLDAPFISHRILLQTPEESEDFATDLMVSEFQSILRVRRVGSEYIGKEAIRLSLTEMQRDGRPFKIQSETDKASSDITLEKLMLLVELGCSAAPEAGLPKSSLADKLYLLFKDSVSEGVSAHHDFSRASTLFREAHTHETEASPKLDFGTIVQREGQYFVCLQPICDTVRLKAATPFIFIPADIAPQRTIVQIIKPGEESKDAGSDGVTQSETASGSKEQVKASGKDKKPNGTEGKQATEIKEPTSFDIVVKSPEGADCRLRVGSKASQTQTFRFSPNRHQAIFATQSGDQWTFHDEQGSSFRWIADIRGPYVQRLAQRVANDLSRIGLDEFEWLRRKADRNRDP